MKTPAQIAHALVWPTPDTTIHTSLAATALKGYDGDLCDLLVKAVEVDRAQREPAAAHAGDWEVTSFEDGPDGEDGKWITVETYDPDREAANDDDGPVCAASILMSAIEALDLYRALGSAIADHAPAHLPEYDTSGSASRQHYIDTGTYLTHDEITKEVAR
ncbi:hypothetical protein [Agromyces subbeticus]|uniref:hypothetical protein n=1 Tax=Agromyces subbeticus TaxID=293890 RepID=UPI0003B4D192|nr:hypothetical protein [Agromyces subbeticus]